MTGLDARVAAELALVRLLVGVTVLHVTRHLAVSREPRGAVIAAMRFRA